MKWIFVVVLMFAMPAMAEDVSVSTLCKIMPEYRPDGSVAYQPGVDVHGKTVVPGDLNKVMKNEYDAVEIPVEVNLLQYLGVAPPVAGAELKPTVAVLKVYGDGRVKYNDQDVTEGAQKLCTLRPPAPVAPPPKTP